MLDTRLNKMSFSIPEDKFFDKSRTYHLKFIQWNKDGFGFYLITTYLNVQTYTRDSKIPNGIICDPKRISGIRPIFLDTQTTTLLNYYLSKVKDVTPIDELVSDCLFQVCGLAMSDLELTKDIMKQK